MFGNGSFGNGRDGSDVVSMTSHSVARRQAPLRVVEAYWHALFDGDAVPLRSAIDPRGMESALENAFLLERIAPTMAKIRVAGAHLSDLMGMEVSGMPLSTIVAAEDRDRFGEALGRVFADPAVARLGFEAQQGFGRPALQGYMILLPLRSDFGDVTRALGAFVTEGRIGRAPRRFRLTDVDIENARPLSSRRASDADPEAPPSPAADEAAPKPPRRSHRIEARRPNLRLVVSND